MLAVLDEIGESLGLSDAGRTRSSGLVFAGPLPGNDADPDHLARVCWVLALLTEFYRAGPRAGAGPLGQFRYRRPSTDELLTLASSVTLDQLQSFRYVLRTELLPKLAIYRGNWILGPTFTGSKLIGADADLIAAGLLLELKTSMRPTLNNLDVFQVIAYALLDFDDDYEITQVGIFRARYAHLAVWDLGALFDEAAGCHISIGATRDEFHEVLQASQSGRHPAPHRNS